MFCVATGCRLEIPDAPAPPPFLPFPLSLAMVAFVGFIGQHAATSKSPLEALSEHVANPWAANFATNGVSVPGL